MRARVARLGFVGLAALLVALGLLRYWRGRPERYLAIAEERLRGGEVGEALTWLELPEATPRTQDRAWLLHARASLGRGRVREASEALRRVDDSGPWATDLAFWKGRALHANGELLDAVGWFRHVLERRPGDIEALRWLAAASYDLGDSASTVDALRAVVRIKPDDARAWRTLAFIYLEQVEYEQALPAYVNALKADPGQASVRLELAQTLVKLGRHAEAERELAACRGRVAEADRLALLAQCLLVRGEREGLRAALDAGLSANPDHAGLLSQRAQLALAEGRTDEALTALDRAIASDPYREQVYYQRGQVLFRLGRTQDAERDLARSRALKEDIAEISRLDAVASSHPADPDVRYQIGCLCTRVGKNELAASWSRAALACDPAHQGARLGLRALSMDRPASPVRAH